VSQYSISLPACRDLQDITDYFATVNVEAGEEWLRSFNQKCQQLAQFPNIGRRYDDLQTGLRGLALNGYIIFYRTTDEDIEIARVISGKRDLRSLFQV
jgi:toxin ParE1/3/4